MSLIAEFLPERRGLVPAISAGFALADINGQDRGPVLIENHPISPDAKAISELPDQGLHIALPRHGIAVEARFDLAPRIPLERLEVPRRSSGIDDRLHMTTADYRALPIQYIAIYRKALTIG